MNNPFSAVRILLAVFAIVFVVSGCTTAKPTEAEAGVATAAAPAPSTDTSADSDTSAESTDDSASDSSASSGSTGPAPISRYIVQSGDHLWGISGQAQVYGDSYQWPLLYKRNRDDIYDPDEDTRSIGTYMILEHIERARSMGLPYVYLGYWVDGSPKMDYKRRYTPLEVLDGDQWRTLRDDE